MSKMRKSKTSSANQKSKGRVFLPALCSIVGIVLILSVIIAMLLPSLPVFTNYEVFNVVSGSMEPTIPVGSLIIVQPVEPKTIQEGEIIAFTRSGTPVTHRVVSNFSFESEFITKGDANLEADMSAVSYNDLIGVVRYHFDHVGDVLQYLTTIPGKIYMLLVVACGVMFEMLAGRLRES